MMARNKYGNKTTYVDGIAFASVAEARRYQELKLLLQAGEISVLRLQPRYLLQEAFKCEGKKIRKIEYVADFEYFDHATKRVIIEDVKGAETAIFKIKHKLFMKRYGRAITLVYAR